MKKESLSMIGIHKIVKAGCVFILLVSVFSCVDNARNTKSREEDSNKLHALKDSSIKNNLDLLSQSFYNKDLYTIDSCWNSIISEPYQYIDFLLTSEGNNSPSLWYWRDLSKKPLRYKQLYRPSNEIASLFLINAIYYKDYNFAFYRDVYDNTNIDTSLHKMDLFFNINACRKTVDYKKMWESVKIWRQTDMKSRPFFKTPYFWFGEKNGKLQRENTLPVMFL